MKNREEQIQKEKIVFERITGLPYHNEITFKFPAVYGMCLANIIRMFPKDERWLPEFKEYVVECGNIFTLMMGEGKGCCDMYIDSILPIEEGGEELAFRVEFHLSHHIPYGSIEEKKSEYFFTVIYPVSVKSEMSKKVRRENPFSTDPNVIEGVKQKRIGFVEGLKKLF